MAEQHPIQEAREQIVRRIETGDFLISATENLILTDLSPREKAVFERLDQAGLAVLLDSPIGPKVSVTDPDLRRQAHVRRDADIRQWLTAAVAADDYQLLARAQIRIGDEALTPERFQWLDGLRDSPLIAVHYRSVDDIDVLVQDSDLLLFALAKRETALRRVIEDKIAAGTCAFSPDGEVWLKGLTPGQETLFRNSRGSDLVDVQGGEHVIVSIQDAALKQSALDRRAPDQSLIDEGSRADGRPDHRNGTGPDRAML